MKHYSKLFFAAAVAALGLASCAKEVAPVETPKDNLVTVHFGATAGIEGATKATLTPNEQETLFTSAWENGDVLGVKYYNDNMAEEQVVHATWNETSYSFSTALPEFTGRWIYHAAYPAPEADGSVEFGSSRTQKGNAYNSKYDLMRGSVMTEAPAGKTDEGKDIIFDMTRETAIAYFHFTSKLAEKVVSAKLSVTGGSIANSSVTTDYDNSFVFSDDKPLNEITITFEEGTAPDATDFKLWYNVCQTSYSSMTLEVETTDHKMTISRNSSGAYNSGKLYKVVKDIAEDKWVAKGGFTGGELVFNFKTIKPTGWPTSKESANGGGTYKYALENAEYNFIHEKVVYCGGKAPESAYLLISEDNSLGLPAIKGYKLTRIIGTMNDSGSPSTKAKIRITDGTTVIPGGTAQLWDTKGNDYTYTLTDTEENTVYYMSATEANAQLIKLALTYEAATPSAPKYAISFATVEGGTLSASAIKAEEGTEITLTAKPQLGYEFNSDWSVVAADGTAINVVDNKFTMPAQDVTVSCTFVKISYTITKAPAVNGSFTVKLGDTEVTTAQVRDKLTLTATPDDGYTLSKWTVTYVDGETEKSFNPSANTFNMPAANVTVSATFVETAHVPVYASVAELIAAGKPTTTRTKVTVTLTDEEITGLHKVGQYTNGVFLMVGTQEVEVYCKDTPADWKVGGTISGTLTNCDWMLYVNKRTQKETWELCPADYSELTYTAPLPTCATPAINIDENGVASITCATKGAIIRHTVGDAPADPTETSDVFSSATLTDGQTIKAIAFAEGYKPSAVASKKYTAGGAVESKTYTLQFGKEYNSEGKSSYNNTWSATCDGFTWDMTNWNNNNNGWSYVKAGPKGNRNANAKIETAAAIPEAISKISITIDKIENGSITSIVLKSSTTNDFTSETAIETKSVVAVGTVEFTIPSPQNKLYYQLVFTLKNTSSKNNGVATVSKVVYTNN